MKPVRPVPARHRVAVEHEARGSKGLRMVRHAPGVGLYLLRAMSDGPSAGATIVSVDNFPSSHTAGAIAGHVRSAQMICAQLPAWVGDLFQAI